MTRPPIPTDLARRVLVEAGHRCAIPTCRNPDVDLHHIVAWERCNTHDFDNLIALCPNCHRRAHNGEIDRKSLLLYKAQLASAVGVPPIAEVSSAYNATKIAARWSTNRILEQVKTPNPYSAEIEFPQFFPDEGELAEVNIIQKAHALELLHCCRRHSFDEPPTPREWWGAIENVTAASYEVLLLEPSFLSIKYTRYEYGAGAAHGNSVGIAHNYRLRPLVPLTSPHLFHDAESALKAFSAYCIGVIEREKQSSTPDEWLRKGASPHWDHFRCVNILKEGLLVTFQEYQIGPYAEGTRTVFVPAHVICKFVRPQLGLDDLWASALAH